MSKEEWRDIPGYEGIYQVSSNGNVRRSAPGKSTHVGYVLKSGLDSRGYPSLHLTKNGKKHTINVHKAVALAFLGPRPPQYDINHKSGDKTDNRIENLEYVTRRENIAHAIGILGISIGPKGEKNNHAKLTDEDVRQIKKLYQQGFSYRQLARRYSVTYTAIGFIIRGETWKHVD